MDIYRYSRVSMFICMSMHSHEYLSPVSFPVGAEEQKYALQFERRSISVLWLGRSGQRPANQIVRGRAAHVAHGSCGKNGRVTSAMAILGPT